MCMLLHVAILIIINSPSIGAAENCYRVRSENPNCFFVSPGNVNVITCHFASSGRSVAAIQPVQEGFRADSKNCGKVHDLVGWRTTLRKMLQNLGTLTERQIEDELKRAVMGGECGLPFIIEDPCVEP